MIPSHWAPANEIGYLILTACRQNDYGGKQPRIGIDIGGVIDHRVWGREAHDWHRSTSGLVPGAIEAVRIFVLAFGADNVFLISKARYNRQRFTLIWLETTVKFYDRTGF